MSLPFADTPFSSTPLDPLPIIDVYTRKSDAVINNSPISNSDFSAAVSRLIENPSDIMNIVKSLLTNTVSYDRNQLLQRLAALTGGNMSIVTSLSDIALNSLLRRLTNDSMSSYMSIGNDKVVSPRAFPYQTYADYQSTVNAVLGTDTAKTTDTQTETVFYGDLVAESIRLGVSGETLLNLIDQASDDDIKRTIMNRAFNAAVDSGNIDAIETLLTRMSPVDILAIRPNTVPDILSSYKFLPRENSNNYPTLSTKLVNICDAIDPFWDVTIRGSELETDQYPYMVSTKDSLTLLKLNTDHFVPAMVANTYRVQDKLAIQRRYYPRTLIRN